MKPYVLTTGLVFGLITIAHVWRIIAEDRNLAKDPAYLAITLLTAALTVWAWRVSRRPAGG